MHIVTGGAGFIGSNLVRALVDRGHNDVVVVDDLEDGHKFVNIADVAIADYLDKDELPTLLASDKGYARKIKAIFHQGACSTTTEWNGRYMMQNNYGYSKELLHHCLEHRIPYIYASSAAVYGGAKQFVEDPLFENPLNVYGYSSSIATYVRWQAIRTARSLDCGTSMCTDLTSSTKVRWRASHFISITSFWNTARCACSKAATVTEMASSSAILST